MTEAEIRAKDRITCNEAAEFLGMNPNHLRVAMEKGLIPIGTCIRGAGGRRSIHIEKEALIRYKNGYIGGLLMDEIVRKQKELEKRIEELEKQKGA